jgi:hypothetical protein
MTFCCEVMERQVHQVCKIHPNQWECPDCLVSYSPKSKQYGLIIHDGGTSFSAIQFCPWCGTKLSEGSQAEMD